MLLTTELSMTKDCLTLALSGEFTIRTRRIFRQAYQERLKGYQSIIIDFTRVKKMDSWAMGELLLLREQAGRERARILLFNCTPKIRQKLIQLNYQTLFGLDQITEPEEALAQTTPEPEPPLDQEMPPTESIETGDQ